MKTRTTLLLLLVVAALGFFFVKVALVRPGTRAAEMDAAYVAPFNPADAARIRIIEGNDELEFQRQPDSLTWRIVRPIDDRAGRLQIQQVLSTLSAIPHREVIKSPDAGERGEFAISNPKMRVKIDDAQGRRIVELLIGRETILPGGIYLGVEDDSNVYVVDVGVRDVVNQPPDMYRDRQLTAMDPNTIDKIVLGNRDGQIELVRRRGNWRIDRPVSARADPELAGLIAQTVSGARIAEFVADGGRTLSQMGLSEPVGTIALYEEGSDEPHLVQIGGQAVPPPAAGNDEPQSAERPLLYARYPERKAVYKLDATLAEFTKLSPNQLRDRRLCRFLMDVVDRFELHPQNRPSVIFNRNPDSWDMAEPVPGPANSAQIMETLELLRTTRVAAFATDAAGDLAPYGLDAPWLRVVVSSYVSENIPESGTGSTKLADLSLGGYDAEHDGFYAMLADEPFVVVVPRAVTDRLPTSASRWQSLDIFNGSADAVRSIGIGSAGASGMRSITLTRNPAGGWLRLDGHPIATPAPVESCANSLARLRAALRIDPPDSPAAQPLLAITFEAEGSPRSLDVFRENADGFFPATADRGQSYFLISRPDFDALAAPLGLAPANSPTAPSTPQPVVE